jgi:hypothetical protein
MKSAACFLGLLSLAACGAKVTVDNGASTGTSGDLTCEDVCLKTAAACPGNTTPADCMTGCVTTDKLGAACPEAYQAFLACADAQPASQCNGSIVCDTEANAFTACITQVCMADPTKCTP